MASTTELAATAADGYLMSSWGLGSNMEVLRLAALSVVFAEELMRLYAPLVFRGLSFVLLCLPIPNIFGQAEGDDVADGPGGAMGTSSNVDAPIVPEEYVNLTDDRKASKGDDNDIYMLRTHGFNKYRFNSRPFLNRNGLGEETEIEKVEKKSKKKRASRKKKL